MTQGTTPPGWYDDGRGQQRWWDGQRWTEHLRTAQPPPPPPGPAGPGWQPEPRGSRTTLLWSLVGGGLVLVAALAVVLVVVFGGDDDGDDDSDTAGGPPSSQSSSDGDSAEGGATASAAPEPLATPETSAAPEPPDPADPDGGGGAGSDNVEAMTCGEIRAMSTDQLLDLLDTAAALDAVTDDSAQEYLDLPDSTRRAFAEQLPTACLGEADGTTLGELDSF